MTAKEVAEICAKIRRSGYAVVAFNPEELRGANPDHVEDRLVELGWDVIGTLASIESDKPTDEDWNWSIK